MNDNLFYCFCLKVMSSDPKLKMIGVRIVVVMTRILKIGIKKWMIFYDEPLPEPIQDRSSSQTLTILLQQFSDNGLEWLFRFMFQFMHVTGLTFRGEYLCQLSLMLPRSLYLLREFVHLKRDNFIKFAVCPECASLHNLESCTRLVGGQIVSKVCSHRPFSKGRNSECGTA